MKWFPLSAIILCFVWGSSSFANVNEAGGAFPTPAVESAFQSLLELDFEKTGEYIKVIKEQVPGHPVSYLLENYIDFLTLFIGEDERDYERLIAHKDMRIDAIRRTSKQSPYYRFSEAHIRLQWALVMLKFDHRIRAFKEISNAYYLIEKNRKAFPGFLPDQMSYGFIQAILGAMPEDLKWWVSWIGIEGDVDEGIKALKSVLGAEGEARMFVPEAVGMLSFILVNFKNDPSAAVRLVEQSGFHSSQSLLSIFLQAHLALKRHKASEALEILKQTAHTRDALFPFLYLDYMKGLALLELMDPRAEQYFKHYIRAFKGRHYIKEALQKLAWCDVLFHEGKSYKRIMQVCMSKGAAETDADKAAKREAEEAEMPDKLLLRARLLFDGGAFDRAMELLRNPDIRFAGDPYKKGVAYYLQGRIYEMKKEFPQAIHAYQELLGNEDIKGDYRYSNAHLHLGYMYAQLGKKALAEKHFRSVLALHPTRYKNSLHAKATAGINQLSH